MEAVIEAATGDPILHGHVHVLTQVTPDLGGVVQHTDTQRVQQCGRADARQLQQLRRFNGTGAQQHLAAHFEAFLAGAVVDLHVTGTVIAELDALNIRAGH
ncbi:hypothetical protein D3C87_1895420 [compost metagenome]